MNTSVYQFAAKEVEETLEVLNTAINNHRLWFDNLHTSIICDKPFSEDILNEAAHTQCQFGKWYYGDVPPSIRAFKEFSELESVHQYMHDNARELAHQVNNEHKIIAENYKEFLDNQHHLIDLLTNLRDTLIEHQYCFDSLTGAVNRKSVSLLLEKAFENAQRYNHVYSVAMIDVDHFKKINDVYGHIAGDQVLKRISLFFRKLLRKSDCFGRYGGEEFLVILPETDSKSAFELMDQYRNSLSAEQIEIEKSVVNISVSIGVSQVKLDDEGAWLVVKRADAALYRAKAEGRNCVIKI